MTQNYFTPRDRGEVEEIKIALQQLEKDYMLDLSTEKEWLDGLDSRFGKPLTKQQPAEVTVGNAVNNLKKEVSDIETIKAEVSRIGSAAYENYTRDNSDKEYWTYMTCKRITNFIKSLSGENQMIREKVEKAVESVLKEMFDKEK